MPPETPPCANSIPCLAPLARVIAIVVLLVGASAILASQADITRLKSEAKLERAQAEEKLSRTAETLSRTAGELSRTVKAKAQLQAAKDEAAKELAVVKRRARHEPLTSPWTTSMRCDAPPRTSPMPPIYSWKDRRLEPFRNQAQSSGAKLRSAEGWFTFPAEAVLKQAEDTRQRTIETWTGSEPQPDVAICLVGELRSLREPRVVALLKQGLEGFGGDLFAVVGNAGGNNENGWDAISRRQWKPASVDAIDMIRASLRPVRWIESYEERDATTKCARSMQLAKLGTCHALIEAHELQQLGRRYDWVIRARPDVVFSPPPANWHYKLRRDTVYRSRNSGDLMMIMHRNAFGAVSCGWRFGHKCINETGTTMLGPSLIDHGLLRSGFGSDDTHFINCVIVRSTDLPKSCKVQEGTGNAICGESLSPSLWDPASGKGVAVQQLGKLPNWWQNDHVVETQYSIIYNPSGTHRTQSISAKPSGGAGKSMLPPQLRRPTVATEANAASHALRWTYAARPLTGFCGVTKEAAPNRCGQDRSGAWPLSTLHECVLACSACRNCAFLSFSGKNRDCSWYASCERLGSAGGLSPLHQQLSRSYVTLNASLINGLARAGHGTGVKTQAAPSKRRCFDPFHCVKTQAAPSPSHPL